MNTELDRVREADADALRKCLGFFASVIKSGEPWTDACQREYDAALSAPPAGNAQARVDEALSKYAAMRDHVGGCTDGSCVIKRPTGMHTNGGCKCWQDKIKAQRMMHAGQELFAALTPQPSGEVEG